jgi:hypothetical protein
MRPKTRPGDRATFLSKTVGLDDRKYHGRVGEPSSGRDVEVGPRLKVPFLASDQTRPTHEL